MVNNELTVIKYKYIDIEIEVEKQVENTSFEITAKHSITKSYGNFEDNLVDLLRAVKKFAKDSTRVVITLNGHDTVWEKKAIKRYTLEPQWDMQLEHRPFEDNCFAVKTTDKFDTPTKLLNALAKDVKLHIEKHVSEKE